MRIYSLGLAPLYGMSGSAQLKQKRAACCVVQCGTKWYIVDDHDMVKILVTITLSSATSRFVLHCTTQHAAFFAGVVHCLTCRAVVPSQGSMYTHGGLCSKVPSGPHLRCIWPSDQQIGQGLLSVKADMSLCTDVLHGLIGSHWDKQFLLINTLYRYIQAKACTEPQPTVTRQDQQ